MKAVRLRIEYLKEPIGIDIRTPRIYWNAEGGKKQTAYRIVAEGSGKVKWDTGKVSSSRMTHIAYEGEPLESRERINFRVTLWDENDVEGEASVSFFEMGLLWPTDWSASWITGDYRVNRKKRYPVDCFRKRFTASDISAARLYVASCGVYEGELNGRRIGDFVLAPGHTDYRKRIQYQTYDVTNLVQSGENELTFQLADGWFRGSCGAWGIRNQYGSETKLIAELCLKAPDGTETWICTDDTFEWSNDGPIRFADNKDGEIVDANRTPGYSGKAKETICSVVPKASNNVFITEHEQLKPEVLTTPSGKTILDFKQNIAGYVGFSLKAKKGDRVFLRFGEMLDCDGEFSQKNIQCISKKKTTPLQQVDYTCKDGENNYKTKFAIFGFRYVLVEADVEIRPEDFTAFAVYSDMETTMRFNSSNDLLNRFVDATLWSAKNNAADVPTDCPTRERHGWTGDSQVFCVTANYLMNYYPFERKHIRDLTDWQDKAGRFPQIAPAGGVDFYMNTLNGSVGWADAGVLIPYRLWKLYGDKQIISDNYGDMARYARFMMKRCGKNMPFSKRLGLKGEAKKYAVNIGQSYGEWAEPAEVFPNRWTDMVFPHPEVSTAYTAFVMAHMAEIARALGKDGDAKVYETYHEKVKSAYQAMRHTELFPLDTDRQAMLVRPLYMNLLNAEDTEYAKKRLLKALENYGWRLGTGFLSTPLILYVLGSYDLEAAYRLLENEEMPGWLFMPKKGATTIWESWEGTEAQGGIASLNHYSKGAVCEWVFSEMCGIQIGGENRFRLCPKPGGHFTYAKAEYASLYGMVSCGFEKTDSGLRFEISVPPNCTADILLPDGREIPVESGQYTYTL